MMNHTPIAPSATPPASIQRPRVVQSLLDAVVELESCVELAIDHHQSIREVIQRRRNAGCDPVMPREFTYQAVPPVEPDQAKRAAILKARIAKVNGLPGQATLELLVQHRDCLFWEICDSRQCLQRVLELLSEVAPLMDNPHIVASQRWTAQCRTVCQALRGSLGTIAQPPMPRLDDETFEQALLDGLARLQRLADDLKVLGPESGPIAMLPDGSRAVEDRSPIETTATQSVPPSSVPASLTSPPHRAHDEKWLPARWYDTATGGVLTPDRLRMAANAGRIVGRKLPNSRWNAYYLDSVMQAFPELADVLRSAVSKSP